MFAETSAAISEKSQQKNQRPRSNAPRTVQPGGAFLGILIYKKLLTPQKWHCGNAPWPEPTGGACLGPSVRRDPAGGAGSRRTGVRAPRGVSAERVGSRWLRGLWTFYPCPLPCFCTMLDPWPGKRQVRNGGNVGVGVFLRVRCGLRGMGWAPRDWCGCVAWGALGHLGALPGPFVLCFACCLPAVCVCCVFRTGSCVCCVCG